MLIKLSNIYSIHNILQKYKNEPLPVRASYNIALTIAQLEQQAKFYNEKMQQLLERYAETDENGFFVPGEVSGSIKLKSETLQEGQQAFTELETMEVELDSHISLYDLEKLNISIGDMEQLLPIIKSDADMPINIE